MERGVKKEENRGGCEHSCTLEVQKKVSTPLLFRFQKSTEARLFGPDQDIHTGSSTRLVNNAVEDGEGEKRPNSKNMTKKTPQKIRKINNINPRLANRFIR